MTCLYEAFDSNNIKHESLARNIQLPKDYGQFNCLAGTIAVAFNALGQVDLTERQILESLPIPFDLRYMSMARMYEVVRVVAQKNHLSIGWYQKEIRYSKKDFIDSLVEHLKEGDLVHLMVEGDRWTKNVYGIKERRGEKHAVLVVGYEKHDSIVEFSICDSMTNSKRSISVDKIFKSVVGSEFGKINNILHFGIPIGIFQGV